MTTLAGRLTQRAWVRRLLIAAYVVGLITTVLTLFLAGPDMLGMLAGALAVVSGGILHAFPKEKR